MNSSSDEASFASDADYRAEANAVLSAIERQVDAWLQADVIDIDPQRNGGMLELSFPNRSKIIVNMQPPLQELWLAAKAGGMHYRFANGVWRDTRDGSEFFEVLSREASAQAGRALSFKP